MSTQPNSVTHHAIEAVKHLWMVPATILAQPEPEENLRQSMMRKARVALDRYDDADPFWFFSTAGLAYARMAATAIVNTLANYDNRDEVGELGAEFIDDDLSDADNVVTVSTAPWFEAAQTQDNYGSIIRQITEVADHTSGFDCTRNISQPGSWFSCASHRLRETPCLVCPSIKNLGTLICSTDLEATIDYILEMAQHETEELDLEQLGPMPEPEHPVIHCFKAIVHIAQMAPAFKVRSVNHRGIAYAAIAVSDAVQQLAQLHHEATGDDDIFQMFVEADHIAANILAGEPTAENLERKWPDEGEECILVRELTTGNTHYICAPPNPPRRWNADDCGYKEPCRLCPMKSSVPETPMDRMIQRLAELPGDK